MGPVNCREEATEEITDVEKLSYFPNIQTKEKKNVMMIVCLTDV